jgi:diadenosine tetraphosphate (Ap4A) HIT family hydrolase
MGELPEPFDDAVFYEDSYIYACLANFPKVRGHSVVVWKDEVEDLHLLSRDDYEHLMDKVDEVRDAMLEVLDIEKVYLVYMDETEHVHWHLIPRYNEKGYDVLKHDPGLLEDFELAEEIEERL